MRRWSDGAALLKTFTSLQIDIQNFALVTHAVPAERVRAHVPERFRLQTFVDDDGREKALVSANGFCNRQTHLSGLRYPAHDFDQVTFRTYVDFRGRRGSYFFGTYVSTRLSWVGQFSVARNTWLADFDVDVRLATDGYESYRCRAAGPRGEVAYRVEAAEAPAAKVPFTTGDDLAGFITHRLWGFTKSPAGIQIQGRVDHRRMHPFSGRLLEGNCGFWERMGILEPDEFEDAYSVLVEPSVRFTLFPPRPAI